MKFFIVTRTENEVFWQKTDKKIEKKIKKLSKSFKFGCPEATFCLSWINFCVGCGNRLGFGNQAAGSAKSRLGTLSCLVIWQSAKNDVFHCDNDGK